MATTGAATVRRKRQVRWAKRLRRLGSAWENALEIARAGRLTAPYGAPFEVVHEESVYRLRRYTREVDGAVVTAAIRAPLLLVPPLMVASEVYDISPEVSAVAALGRAGADVWLVDFGAPEREAGGMDRTLDDHVRAVSEAIDRVRAATGHDVHLAGYSQGGMFCYQAAAFRRSAGLASVITMGSPVDLHRAVPLGEDTTERIVAAVRSAVEWPLSRIEGLPGVFTSTGFKLLSARKELGQLVDFVRKLHDRGALEKREAKRLFLAGQGFVAWPGPAFRKFVDELIVGNRMQSGGFVIDGHSVTLADLTCPILYFLGSRDEMGRPAAVRGIKRAAPRASAMYEVPVAAGHFGLVVGSTALAVTWPSVVEWMKWREGTGAPPRLARDVSPSLGEYHRDDGHAGHHEDDDHDDHHVDAGSGEHGLDLQYLREVAGKTARAALDQVAVWADDLGLYLDHARWQVPRLDRLRRLTDETVISLGKSLADRAAKTPDGTFFLWRGRAFTYADANRRVDAVVRGLVACGIRAGQKVGVMMKSRPSQLSLVTALNRLGAIAVLLSPDTTDAALPRALELGEASVLVVDPDSAARARAAVAMTILVLGGVGEVPYAPGTPRLLPAGVIDMESVDPAGVTLPAWYRPNAGRARDLAMIFVTSGPHEPARAARITNRRWAFSALGAAAAATLTTRDTVYCCLPLHHPSGALVAVGSALVSGARLALAMPGAGGSATWAATFWDEVRRYGVSVVYYAGEMCRQLVDAPPVRGEMNNPVRLFAGSGMRADVWRDVVQRFGPVGVLELYASSEASTVLANASGKPVGSVGRPLPGSPEVAIAAWDAEADDFLRAGAGHLVHAGLDEAGMLVARLGGGADTAYIDPARVMRDAFAPGDLWFVTGDFFAVDPEGNYRFVDRQRDLVRTRTGLIPSTQIEDALYAVPAVALCIASHHPDPADPAHALPHAAVQLHPTATARADVMAGLATAVAALPEAARPRHLRIVAAIPLTDGYRPIKSALRGFDPTPGPDLYYWDPLVRRYAPSV